MSYGGAHLSQVVGTGDAEIRVSEHGQIVDGRAAERSVQSAADDRAKLAGRRFVVAVGERAQGLYEHELVAGEARAPNLVEVERPAGGYPQDAHHLVDKRGAVLAAHVLVLGQQVAINAAAVLNGHHPLAQAPDEQLTASGQAVGVKELGAGGLRSFGHLCCSKLRVRLASRKNLNNNQSHSTLDRVRKSRAREIRD